MKSKILQLLIGIIIMGFSFYLIDFRDVINNLKHINGWALLWLMICLQLQYIVMSFRWHYLSHDCINISFFNHCQIYFKSIFYNFFTPANIAGDMYRFYQFKTKGCQTKQVVQCLFQERILGLCSFGVFAVFSLIISYINNHYHWPHDVFYVCFIGLTVGPIIFVLIIVILKYMKHIPIPVITKYIAIFNKILHFFYSKRYALSLVYSFIALFCWVYVIYAFCNFIHFPVPFYKVCIVTTLSEIIRLIPISFQGIGIRENTFALLMSYLGYPYEMGFFIGTAVYLLLSVSIIICGALGYSMNFMDNHDSD